MVALRDSEILAVPREVFFEACEADTAVMIELAKLMMLRSRQAVMRGGVGEPSVFGFVPFGPCGALRPLADRIAMEIAALGYLVYHWVGREAVKRRTLSDLAGRLEQAFPHFEGTLRSTVEFVRPTRGEIPGSEDGGTQPPPRL